MTDKAAAAEQDPLVAKVLASLSKASPEELRKLVSGHQEIARIKKNLGPQTKDELWQFFKDKYDVELIKVAVCPGHVSQLDFVWWVYTFGNVLGVFSRGWGKTSLSALVDDCQAVHYPGWSVFTIGPGKEQGERKYEHLLPYVVEGGIINGKELPHVGRSILTRTEYKNGSKIEIALGGHPENAAGPRAPRLHRDEIELMLDATRKKAVNIPAGKQTRDGRYVPAQTVDTSTMTQAGGYVDLEVEAYLKKMSDAGVDHASMDPIEAFHLAVKRGHRPRKLLLLSCIYEVAAERPTCRSVSEDARRSRLLELKQDPDEICDCHTYTSGHWDSDDPSIAPRERTLEDVCQGRFFRSRGYQQFGDIQTFFLDNDRASWEAEKECSQPSREGAYLRAYSRDRHGIRDYKPDPENGSIFSTTDWGGADLYWHGWVQELDRPVETHAYKGDAIKLLPVGSRVFFGEISIANIGNIELGKMVQERELQWMLEYPGWRVEERYYDYALRNAMLDWRDQLGMPMISRIKKDFAEEVKMVRTEVGAGRMIVAIDACPVMDKGLHSWRQVNGREVHDHASHPVAGARYYLSNRRVIERALVAAGSRRDEQPMAAGDEDRPAAREEELHRGVHVIRQGERRGPGQQADGVMASEDSPARQRSSSMPGLSLHTERSD